MPPKPGDWYCPDPRCNNLNFASRNTCKRCGQFNVTAGAKGRTNTMPPAKAGDWNCAHCSFPNFASRNECKNCGVPNHGTAPSMPPAPAAAAPAMPPPKAGDWSCINCSFSNFASRTSCKNCGSTLSAPSTSASAPASAPAPAPAVAPAMPPTKAGDWQCIHCLFSNFASRTSCKNCGVANNGSAPAAPIAPPPTRGPVDWFCPCHFVNFASRTTCKNCGLAKGGVPLSQRGTSSTPPPAAAAAAAASGASGSSPSPSVISRAGDWTCAKCTFSNFGSRVKCHQCGGDRPDIAVTTISAPAIAAFDSPSYWSGKAVDKPLLESASFMAAHVAQLFLDSPSVRLQLDSVARIENVSLWLGYRAECERLRVKWATSPLGRCPPLPASLQPKTLTGILDDALGINEVYLLHATSRDVALKIVEGGFDPSFSGTLAGTLFGAGTYFSDSLEKVAGYTRAGGAIIVARVALGDANGLHSANSTSAAFRRPPIRPDGIESDSVVGCAATHKEYIVYRHTKAYPEFIVFLR